MSENLIAGVTDVQIAEWKTKHGDVFMVSLGDEKYIYRSLRRFEYKALMATADASKSFNEDKIVGMCVLNPVMDPSKLPMLKAGTVTSLVELIMAASNFGTVEEPVKL